MSRHGPPVNYVIPSPIGHVYFFATADERFVKIGWSGDVKRRWKDVQAHHPEPLRFLGVLEGTQDLEARWHRDYRSHRVLGEWFRLASDLRKMIRIACDSRSRITQEEIDKLPRDLCLLLQLRKSDMSESHP